MSEHDKTVAVGHRLLDYILADKDAQGMTGKELQKTCEAVGKTLGAAIAGRTIKEAVE